MILLDILAIILRDDQTCITAVILVVVHSAGVLLAISMETRLTRASL
jgi:hypothetical protein